MKTKKYLAALLALVMLLSILPMAAFAASCSHDNVTGTREYDYSRDVIAYYQNTHHKVLQKMNYVCDDCGYEYYEVIKTWQYEAHVDAKKERIDSGTEEGEYYETYKYTCYCGYTRTETVWGSENMSIKDDEA